MRVHNHTQGEQLGELLGACGGLQELEADLCLPAALGMMPGGGGGAAAAALLLSLMYAARDVKAVKLEVRVSVTLSRLCLSNVRMLWGADAAVLLAWSCSALRASLL